MANKPMCSEPGCYGTGSVVITDKTTGKSVFVSCPRCGGKPK